MANTLRLKVFVSGRVAVETEGAVTHCMSLSHEEARLLVVHAELAARPTTPRETTDPSEEEEE